MTAVATDEMIDGRAVDAIVEADVAPAKSAQVLTGDQLAKSALVIAAMAVLATTGFNTVFSSWSFLAPATVGATLAALIVVLGRVRRLLLGEIIGVALLAPLIVGPLVTGGMGFFRGVVFGWAEILSATPPVDPTPALKALPFVAAFIGTLLGCELLRLRELPGIAVAGPLVTLTMTALFSEQTRVGALTVGLVMLLGLLLIARLHFAAVTHTGILVLLLVLGVVGAMASAGGFLLPYTDESSRFDLRDLQVSPWDPLAVASPLTEVKAGLKEAGDTEAPILRVTGDQPLNRWRVASLPAFNGVYWGVAEPDATDDFVPVDTFLPQIEDESLAGGQLSFAVDILEPVGYWLPTAGIPTMVDFRDVTDARMSLLTGTIGVPEKLQPGNSYELTVSQWADLDDDDLRQVEFESDARSAEFELLPPLIRNLAADFSTGIDPLSGRRIIAIRDNLQLGSYDLETPPGHSFGHMATFLQPVDLTEGGVPDEELRPLVGYEELYAASAGVLSRLSDIPTRVGVGYVIPDDRWDNRSAEIYASDANAWLEVYVAGTGWTPIDVTPDRQREPEEVDEGTETLGVPVADPPKSPPDPEDEQPPEIEDEVEEEEEEEEEEEIEEEPEETPSNFSIQQLAFAAAASAIGFFVLLMLAIIGLKGWRRRRRRRADSPSLRIAGAWAELVDRVDEAGGELPPRATPREAAELARSIDALAAPEVSVQVEQLADHVSVAAFHPVPPSVERADATWDIYDDVAASMRGSAGVGNRIKRALDPRPLREDARAGVR